MENNHSPRKTNLQEITQLLISFALIVSVGFNIYQSRHFGAKLDENANDVKRLYDSGKALEDSIQARTVRTMDSMMNSVKKREKKVSKIDKKIKDEKDIIHNADGDQLASLLKGAGFNPTMVLR